MTLINKCIDYLKANPTYAIILAVALVVILALLIAIISLSAKRSKLKKRLAAEQAQVAQAETANAVESETEEVAANQEETPSAQTEAKAEEETPAAEAAETETTETAEEQVAEETNAPAEETPEETAEETAVVEESVAATESVQEPVQEEPVQEEVTQEAKATQAKKTTKTKKQEATSMLYDELKDAKEEDDVWYDEDETDKVARYAGKWSICHILTDDHNTDDEMYFFELHASNGEKLLSSEEYTSYAGALRGIQTHKTNIEKGNFRITLSKKGDYIFKLLSGKNMLLCMGENYPTRARCENAIKSTKRFAKTAIIDENVQDHIIKVPVEDSTEILPLPEGYNGKWIISSREDAEGEKVFFFELFANNGEKLLSSEEYTTYIGAVNGIQTHKTNIEKGNFRISLTKRGDYIYKLLNGNGQLLCLGEHYKTKGRCQSAVESVKRFAMNSPVLTDSKTTK